MSSSNSKFSGWLERMTCCQSNFATFEDLVRGLSEEDADYEGIFMRRAHGLDRIPEEEDSESFGTPLLAPRYPPGYSFHSSYSEEDASCDGHVPLPPRPHRTHRDIQSGTVFLAAHSDVPSAELTDSSSADTREGLEVAPSNETTSTTTTVKMVSRTCSLASSPASHGGASNFHTPPRHARSNSTYRESDLSSLECSEHEPRGYSGLERYATMFDIDLSYDSESRDGPASRKETETGESDYLITARAWRPLAIPPITGRTTGGRETTPTEIVVPKTTESPSSQSRKYGKLVRSSLARWNQQHLSKRKSKTAEI